MARLYNFWFRWARHGPDTSCHAEWLWPSSTRCVRVCGPQRCARHLQSHPEGICTHQADQGAGDTHWTAAVAATESCSYVIIQRRRCRHCHRRQSWLTHWQVVTWGCGDSRTPRHPHTVPTEGVGFVLTGLTTSFPRCALMLGPQSDGERSQFWTTLTTTIGEWLRVQI